MQLLPHLQKENFEVDTAIQLHTSSTVWLQCSQSTCSHFEHYDTGSVHLRVRRRPHALGLELGTEVTSKKHRRPHFATCTAPT